MKRSLLIGGPVCVLLLVAVAAPALSLKPFHPEPVEFTLAPGRDAVLGIAARRGPGTVSEPVRSPRRFNLVGLSWAGGPSVPSIAVRTRRDGGAWSHWVPLASEPDHGPDPGREPTRAHVTSPTWAGEADWAQYRSSKPLPGVRLRFVNVRGTATAADRMRTAIRRTTSAALISAAGVLRGSTAQAGAPQPPIVSRAGWGAESCPPRGAPELGEVRAAYVHHTVNANDYSRAEAPDVVLGICRYHRNSNGWNDIGYNFLVDRFGTLYEGRAGGMDQAVIGAQAQGYNAQTTGIANLGTFSSVPQAPEALNAMAALIRWKLPVEGAPTAGTTTLVSAGGSTNKFPAGREITVERVIGHRDTGSTACPGNALYAQLPELRRLVGDVRPGGTATRVTAKVLARRSTVRFGSATTVAGRMTVAGGPPFNRFILEVQAFIGSRWRTVERPPTDLQGYWSAPIKPPRTRRLRVRFPGAGDLRRSSSPTVTVAVRPIVRLDRRPVRARAGSAAVLRGHVSPRKRFVYQVLQQRRRGRFRTVGTRRLRVARGGSFRGRFVPLRAAAYRFYVVARADSKTARGASRAYRVTARALRGGGTGAP